MGGQTALNLTVSAAEKGILKRYDIEIIGARLETIRKAEDRQLFKQCMQKIGIELFPEAPCSQIIIQAAGGSVSELRQKMKITW